MRPNPLLSRFRELRSGEDGGLALLFLCALSDPKTAGEPPGQARWRRITQTPLEQLGAAIDRACAACLEQWPEQLEGFFAEPLADEPPMPLAAAIAAVEKAFAVAARDGRHPTILADIYQETRSLCTKQCQGAFFTPWELARLMAEIVGYPTGERWVLEPAIGGGALLIAYLSGYRERHGARAARALTLIGVDIDARSCQIARASLLLAGADPNQFWIFHGDSLAQPIVGRDRRDGTLRHVQFDIPLANPPFGQKIPPGSLATAAARGPLEIPGAVLNRLIPRVSSDRSETAPAAQRKPKAKRHRRKAA